VVVFRNKDLSTQYLAEFNKIWCRSSQLGLNPEKNDFHVIHSHSLEFKFPDPIRNENHQEVAASTRPNVSFA
jgi:hypothetical protein